MFRWKIVTALGMLMAFGMALVIPGGVVIEGRLTRAPVPGTSTPLTITVTKGGLDYFGRILISVPKDCRLSPKQLQGGGMSTDGDGDVVVISWLKLPASDRFDVVLDLVVDPEALPGPRSLEWDFSFIRNNDRVTVRPAPFHFDIAKEAILPPASATQKPRSNDGMDFPASETTRPSAVRSIYEMINGDWEVRIDIEGLPDGGFVKLAEQWDTTCPGEILMGGGSVAQTTPGQATFIWFDYDRAGSVSYRINKGCLSGPDAFIGLLSFVSDEISTEIPVFHAGGESSNRAPEDPDRPSSERIRFEVQVAATKSRVVTDYFERKLKFGLPLKSEEHDGWNKFLHGTYSSYEEARNKREEISSSFGFQGPFVVARRDEQRISVQEALLRTGQKWYP